jgi:hypothetical protein
MIIDDQPARGKGVSFEGVPFDMVPLSMARDIRRIEPIDIRLWCIMLHDGRLRGYVEFTDAELGRLAGVSRQAVQRSLLRLAKAGYIDREGGRYRRIILNAEGDGATTPTLKIRSRG